MRTRIAAAAAATAIAFPAAAELQGRAFDYQVGDKTFEGYVARNTDISEPRGTVMIVHDWDGLTDYERQRADMLAAMGYTAVSVDVYGKEVEPSSREEYQSLSGALYEDRETFRQRLSASLEAAKGLEGATDDVVVMGYCFGGAAVLELARSGADVEGFVSFHGGLGTPDGQSYENTEAPILLLHGSADPVSGMDALATVVGEMQSAGVEHDAQIFGGAEHSFTVWGSDDYDLDADQGSWTALQMFLDNQL